MCGNFSLRQLFGIHQRLFCCFGVENRRMRMTVMRSGSENTVQSESPNTWAASTYPRQFLEETLCFNKTIGTAF